MLASVTALVLTVLVLVAGGVARENVWAIWTVFGAVTVGDLVLSFPRARSIEPEIAEEVFVGEDVTLTLRVAPAPQRLTGRVLWPEGLRGPAVFRFDNGMASVPLAAVRRGKWLVDDLRPLWQSRLGFFEFLPRKSLGLNVRVVPNIRLVQSGQITTTVVSQLFGTKENRMIGEGSEFHQLRDFVPGMDIKSIDWKRSAHKGGLVAKELRAERNHHVIVALDNGYLMREEIAARTRAAMSDAGAP